MPVIGPAAALAGGGWVKAPFETTARYRFALFDFQLMDEEQWQAQTSRRKRPAPMAGVGVRAFFIQS